MFLIGKYHAEDLRDIQDKIILLPINKLYFYLPIKSIVNRIIISFFTSLVA
jgi:hypothetical protein